MEAPSGAERAEAFVRRLGAEHGEALFGWAVRRFSDRRDAEEVVAETLARAWRFVDSFDASRGSERSWLFGIARNTAVDHFRRGRRHLRAVPTAELPDSEAIEGGVASVAESTVVRDALMAVSPAHREVLVLAHYAGMTIGDIARRLGIPSGTVKSRLYYGMRSLRAALEERGVLR